MSKICFVENWMIGTPVLLIIGLGFLFFTLKHPQNEPSVLAENFRGFLAGNFFIILGLMLFVDARFFEFRSMLFSVILLTTSLIFFLSIKRYKKINKVEIKDKSDLLISIILAIFGIVVLFLD